MAPPGFTEVQVKKGVQALFAFIKSEKQKAMKSSLFEEDVEIFLTINLKKMPAKTRSKPTRVPLPHTLYPEDETDICLITKDPQKEWEEKLTDHPKVKAIAIQTLRKEYKQYKDKRDLLASFDLFLADERVVPLLPPLLGKTFFQKKRQPLGVTLKGGNLGKVLAQARTATSFFLSGKCCSVRVANSGLSADEAVENIIKAMDTISDKIPRKWKGIQALYIKTADSAALPIFTSLPVTQRIESVQDAAPQEETKTLAKRKSPADTTKRGSKKKRRVLATKQKQPGQED